MVDTFNDEIPRTLEPPVPRWHWQPLTLPTRSIQQQGEKACRRAQRQGNDMRGSHTPKPNILKTSLLSEQMVKPPVIYTKVLGKPQLQ
ncbi:hypothetical protein L2E82_06058 [Cichorium intybus]|uniref:Uncharacterized protein n=1 Tax=Cichorium intybus TaxID=13427 RepID=A0ACB9H9J2_CICIN|nr:hypothetical protein L2E82_06058 [Cichorium intybus]